MIDNNAFDRLMKELCLFENSATIAIAVSGGADSLALTYLAQDWAEANNAKIIALTVDHNFRAESTDEAKQVAAWMKQKNIEHHIITNKNQKPDSNIMDAARNLRYNLLTDWCNENNILHLAVAHHADDQIETLLLRLERGSGVDGLAAIAPISYKNGIRILRPLLGAYKDELIQYLNEKSLNWIEDPSNDNHSYKRNALRSAIGKIQEDDDLLNKRLLNTTKNMARARNALEQQTAQAAVNCIKIYKQGYGELNLDKFSNSHEEIKLRLISQLLTTISGNEKPPRMEKLQNLLQSLNDKDAIKGITLHGCKIEQQNNSLLFIREQSAIAKKTPLEQYQHWDNRFIITAGESYNNHYISTICGNNLKLYNSIFATDGLPRNILYTLPIIKTLSDDGVEIIAAIPHIDYYNNNYKLGIIKSYFAPIKLLAANPFGCYVESAIFYK